MFSIRNPRRGLSTTRLLLCLIAAGLFSITLVPTSMAHNPKPHCVAADADGISGIRDPGSAELSRSGSDDLLCSNSKWVCVDTQSSEALRLLIWSIETYWVVTPIN